MDIGIAFMLVFATVVVSAVVGIFIRYYRSEKEKRNQSRIKTCTLCDKKVSPFVAEMAPVAGKISIFPCTGHCGKYICRGCYAGSKKCAECWIDDHQIESY